MILELVIGECACCGHTSILFNSLEDYVCVDRDTCNRQEAPKKEQTVYIGVWGPTTSMYYKKQIAEGKI